METKLGEMISELNSASRRQRKKNSFCINIVLGPIIRCEIMINA